MAEKEPDKKRPRTPRKNPTPRKRPCAYDESAPYSSPEDAEEPQRSSCSGPTSKPPKGVRSLAQSFNISPDEASRQSFTSGSPAKNTRGAVTDVQRRSPRKKSNGKTIGVSQKTDKKSTPKSKSKKKSKQQKHAEMQEEIAKVKQRLAELKAKKGTPLKVSPSRDDVGNSLQNIAEKASEVKSKVGNTGKESRADAANRMAKVEEKTLGLDSKDEQEAIEVLSTLSERVSELSYSKGEKSVKVESVGAEKDNESPSSGRVKGKGKEDAEVKSEVEENLPAGDPKMEVDVIEVESEVCASTVKESAPVSNSDDIIMTESIGGTVSEDCQNTKQNKTVERNQEKSSNKTKGGSKTKSQPDNQGKKSPRKKPTEVIKLDVTSSIVDQILPRLTQRMEPVPEMEPVDLSQSGGRSKQKQSKQFAFSKGASLNKKPSPKDVLSTWKSPSARKTPKAPASVVTAWAMRSSVEKVKRRVRFSPDKAVRAARARLMSGSARSEPAKDSNVLPAGNGDVDWVDADILPLQEDDEHMESSGDLSPKSGAGSGRKKTNIQPQTDLPKTKSQQKNVKKPALTPPSPGKFTVRTSRRLAIKKESKMLKSVKGAETQPKGKRKGKTAAKKDQSAKCDESVVIPELAPSSVPSVADSGCSDNKGKTQLTCNVISKSGEVINQETKGDIAVEGTMGKAKRGQKRKGTQSNVKRKGGAKRQKCDPKPSPASVVEQIGQLSKELSVVGVRSATMSPVKDEGALAVGYDLHVSDNDMESPTKRLHNLSQIILGLNQDSQTSPPALSATAPQQASPKATTSTTPVKKSPATPKKTPLKVSFRFRTPTKTPPRLSPGRMGTGVGGRGASARSPARFVGRFSPQVRTSQLSFQEESSSRSSSTKLPLPPKVGRVTCSAIEVLDTQAPYSDQPVPSTSTAGSNQPSVVSVTPSPRRRPARRSLNLGRSITVNKKRSPTFKMKRTDSAASGSSTEPMEGDAEQLSPEEIVDSPHDRLKIVEGDDDDDQWEDEDLDEQLEKRANSQSIRLTARNVKTIIKEVITNEHVLDMVRNTLLEEGLEDQLKEAIFEPRMTRGIVKKAMEKGKIPTLWPMTPTKGANPPAATLTDIEFPEDEEDEDYNPLNDESDVDSESVVSSRASDLGSPRSHIATPTPGSPTTPAMLRIIPEDAETSNTPHTSTWHLAPPAGSHSTPGAEQGGASAQEAKDEPPLSLRLRSKMSLTDTPLEQIEASFVAPDITPDLYNKVEANTRNEKDWQVFLASLTATQEPELNDTYDENNDPEYNFLEESEPIDSEEQRNDKGVKVTKKELSELMDELFDAYQDCLDEDTKGDLPLNALVNSLGVSPTKAAYKPKMPPMTTNTPASFLVVHGVQDFIKEHDYILDSVRGPDSEGGEGQAGEKSEPIPQMSAEELVQLQDQMRKHVQLLAQTFVMACGDKTYQEAADQATNLLSELNVFGSAHLKTKGTVSVFHPVNLAATLHLVQTGLPETANEKLQMHVHKNLKKKGWKRTLGPPEKLSLTWPQMEFFSTSEIFLFPQMLPETRFFERNKKPAFSIFSEAEDNLLCMGVAQFEKLGNRAEHAEFIRQYMMPTKTERQISLRIKRLRNKETPDNAMKQLIKTKKLPEFERYLMLEAPEDICAPEDRDPELMPFWFKVYEKVKNDYKEGKISLEMDPDTSRCSTPESLLDESTEVGQPLSLVPCQSRKPIVRGTEKKTSTPRSKKARQPPIAALSPLVTSESTTVNVDLNSSTTTTSQSQSLLVSPEPSSAAEPVTQYIILTNTPNGLEASPAPSVPPSTETSTPGPEPGTPTPVIIMSSAELQQYGAQMINTLAVTPSTPTVSQSIAGGMQAVEPDNASQIIPLVGSIENGNIVASPVVNQTQVPQLFSAGMTPTQTGMTSMTSAVTSPAPTAMTSDVHDVVMSPAPQTISSLPDQMVTSHNDAVTSPAPSAVTLQVQNDVMSPAPEVVMSYGDTQEAVTSSLIQETVQAPVIAEEPEVPATRPLPIPFPMEQPSQQVMSPLAGAPAHLPAPQIMSPAVSTTPTQSTTLTAVDRSHSSPVPVSEQAMTSPPNDPQSSNQLTHTESMMSPPTFKTPSKSSFITPDKGSVIADGETPPSKLLSPANLLLTGGSQIDSPDIDSCQLHLEADHHSFNTSTEKSFDDSDTSGYIMNTPQKFIPNEELSCSPSAYSDRSTYSNSPGFSDKSLDTPTKSAVEFMAAYAEYLSPTPTKGRSPSKMVCSTPSPRKRLTPGKSWLSPSSSQPLQTTPIRFRSIEPKPGPKTPTKPMSPLCKQKSKSPRRKILQQKARAILPKGFVASTFSLSPTKKAANSLRRRARTRSGLRRLLPKAEVRRLDLGGDDPVEPPQDECEDTDIDVLETDFASEYDTLDSEYASEENQSADEKENNAKALAPKPVSAPAPKAKRQRRWKKKEKKAAEYNDSGSEDDGFGFGLRLGADSQDEGEEGDQFAQFMAASTTIRFDPKSRSALDRQTNKSKAKAKREMTLTMLAPDLVGGDVMRDERDTAFAQAFLTRVKDRLKDDKGKLEAFIKTLYEFGQSERTPVQLHQDVGRLLADYPDVTEDFSGFLLPEQAQQVGCFPANMEFGRARTFMRKLEVFFGKHPSHLQKIFKALSSWKKGKTSDQEELRKVIVPLLRGQQHLIDEFTRLFSTERPPIDHSEDYEEVTIGGDEDSGDLPSPGSSMEEVSLPEATDDALYGTSRCRCRCHAVSDKLYARRKQHCHSCSMKIIRGKLYMQTMEKTLRPVQVQFLGPVPQQTRVAGPGEEEEGAKDDALSSDEEVFVDTTNDPKKYKPARKRATKSRAKVKPADPKPPVEPRAPQSQVVHMEPAETASPVNVTEDSMLPTQLTTQGPDAPPPPTDFSILRMELMANNTENQAEAPLMGVVENNMETTEKVDGEEGSQEDKREKESVIRGPSPPNCMVMCEATQTGAVLCRSGPLMRVASKDIRMTQVQSDSDNSSSSNSNSNSQGSLSNNSHNQTSTSSNSNGQDGASNLGQSTIPVTEDSQSQFPTASCMVRGPPGVVLTDEAANMGRHATSSTTSTSGTEQILLRINLSAAAPPGSKPVPTEAGEGRPEPSSQSFLHDDATMGFNVVGLSRTTPEGSESGGSKDSSGTSRGSEDSSANSTKNVSFVEQSDINSDKPMETSVTTECDQDVEEESQGERTVQNPEGQSVVTHTESNKSDAGQSDHTKHQEPVQKTDWTRDDDKEILLTCKQLGPTVTAFQSVSTKLVSRPTIAQVEQRFAKLMKLFENEADTEGGSSSEDEEEQEEGGS